MHPILFRLQGTPPQAAGSGEAHSTLPDLLAEYRGRGGMGKDLGRWRGTGKGGTWWNGRWEGKGSWKRSWEGKGNMEEEEEEDFA